MNDNARMMIDQLGETTIPSIGNALHELKDRRAYLQYLIRKKEKSIAKAPEGYLIVQKAGRGESLQYYRVTYDERNRRRRTYISKRKDLPLIQALAQKDYDRKVLEAANLELAAIDGLLTHIPKNSAENIYALLDLQRALLVHPDVEPTDVFIAKWQGKEYDGNPYPIQKKHYTARGEIVRSKSEVEIANFLFFHGIPYRYEYPLKLRDGHQTVTYYPDFVILDPVSRKVILLEHLGRMDDPEYVEEQVRKRRVYEDNGFFEGENIIYTWETGSQPLTRVQLERKLGHYLHLGLEPWRS
ncbi:MAG: hypothetical protein IJ771_07705 [Clostridia bacterium]|nr:hypothetical protein [Clostridia bacterium]